MTLRIFFGTAIAACLISCGLLAQEPSPPPPPPQRISLESVPRPPVPADPLELVTGDAQTVEDVVQRAAEKSMLVKAESLTNVRAQPYDLKTTFTSYEASGASEQWIVEDASPARTIYRWSAQGPAFSGIYLSRDSLLSSDRPSTAIPLRLAQDRDAIFYAFTWEGPRASFRVATGYLNGAELHCILIGHEEGQHVLTGSRNWNEFEYCIDPKTGLLQVYSPAPGIYVRYEYANAVHFHDRTIPGGFTITEGGRTVLESRTVSVTDPGDSNSQMFSAQGLAPLGVGASTAPADVVNVIAPTPTMIRDLSHATMMTVVVDCISGEAGGRAEAEVLTSTDTGLDQTALDLATKWELPQHRPPAAPGAITPSRDRIYILQFLTGST